MRRRGGGRPAEGKGEAGGAAGKRRRRPQQFLRGKGEGEGRKEEKKAPAGYNSRREPLPLRTQWRRHGRIG